MNWFWFWYSVTNEEVELNSKWSNVYLFVPFNTKAQHTLAITCSLLFPTFSPFCTVQQYIFAVAQISEHNMEIPRDEIYVLL
jgi:hypothetical protein